MYRIDYEEYWNDFFRKQHQKTFASLSDIEEWISGRCSGTTGAITL